MSAYLLILSGACLIPAAMAFEFSGWSLAGDDECCVRRGRAFGLVFLMLAMAGAYFAGNK